MTINGLLELAKKYFDLLHASPVQMQEHWYSATHIPNIVLFQHLAWMCRQILDGLVFEDKGMIWIGYIQGELRGLHLYSINELREHLREVTT